ncbi:DUF1648 domain-containing protein [Amycolatopsis lurida]
MILLATIALLTSIALGTPMLARPTLPFGVRVAAERANDPAILSLRRLYIQLVVLAAFGAAGVAVLFEPDVRATVVVLAMVDAAFYYVIHRRVRAVKRKEWWQAEHRHGVSIDTSLRTEPVRLPWPWLTPAVLIMLVTVVVGWQRSFEPALAQAGVTLLISVITLLGLRSRPEVDAARPKGSSRRYRIYLRGIARMNLSLIAAINLHLLAQALVQWGLVPRTSFWTAAPYVPLGLGVLAYALWQFRVGPAGHRLPAEPGEEDEDTGLVQRDDDKYWFLAGMIYANRSDPAVLVHRRAGFFWTLNMGHPIAWVVVAALVTVALLSGFGVIDLPERRSIF